MNWASATRTRTRVGLALRLAGAMLRGRSRRDGVVAMGFSSGLRPAPILEEQNV